MAFFGKDKKKSSGAQSAPPSAQPTRLNQPLSAPSIISDDLVVKGTLKSIGAIQIDGRMEGEVRSVGLVIGDQGSVQGDITADDLSVRGQIQGTIHARKVLVRSGARVNGDIFSELLTVEIGSRIEGDCRHMESKSLSI